MKCAALKLKAFNQTKILASQFRLTASSPSSATSPLKKKKASRMIGLVERKISFKNKAVLPLYNSFAGPHWKYPVQFWSPHHAKDIGK